MPWSTATFPLRRGTSPGRTVYYIQLDSSGATWSRAPSHPGEPDAGLPPDDRVDRPDRAGPPAGTGDPGQPHGPGHTRALYVWEWPNYPQYYVPLADVDASVLVDEQHPQRLRRGTAHLYGLRVGDLTRPGAARVYRDDALAGLAGTVRFDWAALDAWYEEDEQVFVHPRNPYVRVDAIRSSRLVRVELDGVVLAETASPVFVFETGLPTRYYVPRTDVRFEHLLPSDTVTECPYKGRTTGYWSVHIGGTAHADLAWTYDFPTRQLLPVAGMIAFYNERIDHVLDGERLERPTTHFFR